MVKSLSRNGLCLHVLANCTLMSKANLALIETATTTAATKQWLVGDVGLLHGPDCRTEVPLRRQYNVTGCSQILCNTNEYLVETTCTGQAASYKAHPTVAAVCHFEKRRSSWCSDSVSWRGLRLHPAAANKAEESSREVR